MFLDMTEIREAKPKDIPLLLQVSIETQMETFAAQNTPEVMEAHIIRSYDPEIFKKEFYEPNTIFYIAWEGPQMAGFLRLRVTDEAEKYLGKSAIELHRLYVRRSFQGKKIGFALMQKAIEYGREKRFEWLWLGVWEKNIVAQEFYNKCGFKQFAEHVFWMGHEAQNDWLLKLKL
jgi:ribosomal protein S18 acetylase RimI-like enzyme